MANHYEDFRKLTFSQRHGLAKLPEVLQVGKLPRRFRNRVWEVISESINGCLEDAENEGFWYTDFNNSRAGRYWPAFWKSYHREIKEMPHDEIPGDSPDHIRGWLRELIFKNDANSNEDDKSYANVLTVLEYMLRLKSIPKKLAVSLEQCFDLAPYYIEPHSPICIVPTTSTEMKKIMKKLLANINQSELGGAKHHLRESAQALTADNFAGSIRESIHAVESAARKIDPKNSKSMSDALQSLTDRNMSIHPALQSAFNRLYGYTSDEQGIRHALIDEDPDKIGFDEAIFMYAACVSFVDYLVRKQSQLNNHA